MTDQYDNISLKPCKFYYSEEFLNEDLKYENEKFLQDQGKPSNPKDAVGVNKTPFSTIPSEVIAEVGLAMMEGACKYGRHNYRTIGVRSSVYYDACMRHLTEWWEGRDIDEESGLHNLTKALACLFVIRDSQIIGNYVDDRPPSLKDGWLQELNKKAEALLKKYPNPKEAHIKVV